jgi:hypothetical protein
MLPLEERIGSLKLLESCTFSLRPLREEGGSPGPQQPVAYLLSPLREHERMDVERRSDRPYLDPWLMTQLHRRNFERRILPHFC